MANFRNDLENALRCTSFCIYIIWVFGVSMIQRCNRNSFSSCWVQFKPAQIAIFEPYKTLLTNLLCWSRIKAIGGGQLFLSETLWKNHQINELCIHFMTFTRHCAGKVGNVPMWFLVPHFKRLYKKIINKNFQKAFLAHFGDQKYTFNFYPSEV